LPFRSIFRVGEFSSQAEIHMVENKEESLARARERGVQLGLNNVWFYQSNMDYYQVIARAKQCLFLTVEHGLLSGNGWGSIMSNFTSPTWTTIRY
jgi:hypothetical protein